MADAKIAILIEAKNKAEKVLKGMKKQISGISEESKKAAKQAAALGGAILVGFGVKAVQAAAEFEKGMTNVATLIDTNTESMADMNKQVLEIASRTPVAMEELTSALYNVRSAGIDAGDAMNVLETSAQLAVAGLGSTEQAVDLATSAINSFGLKGEEVDKAFNTLFVTVKAGKTNIAELAQSFGNVAPIAASAGLSLDELQAATAALTTTGLKASVAQTQLRAAILAIQAPTSEMNKLFDEAGIKNGQLALKNDGLVVTMQKIVDAANGDAEALKKAFGSVEALNSATSLAGEQNEAFSETLRMIEEDSTALDIAFQKQKETAAALYQELKNRLNVVMIETGNIVMKQLMDSGSRLSENFNELTGGTMSLGEAIGNVLAGAIWIAETAIQAIMSTGDAMGQVIEDIYMVVINLGIAWDELTRTWRDSFPTLAKIVDTLKSVYDWVSGVVGKIWEWITAENKRQEMSGGGSGGYSGSYATGGATPSSGSFMVGELGPERVDLPAGARITPNHRLGGGGNNVTINIQGNFVGSEREAERLGDIILGRLQSSTAVIG